MSYNYASDYSYASPGLAFQLFQGAGLLVRLIKGKGGAKDTYIRRIKRTLAWVAEKDVAWVLLEQISKRLRRLGYPSAA